LSGWLWPGASRREENYARRAALESREQIKQRAREAQRLREEKQARKDEQRKTRKEIEANIAKQRARDAARSGRSRGWW
jgi:hypothetical protein